MQIRAGLLSLHNEKLLDDSWFNCLMMNTVLTQQTSSSKNENEEMMENNDAVLWIGET